MNLRIFRTGRIFLRQATEDPLSETMVYIESLIYSDGSVNSTINHQLEIHTNLPGVDFHDWQSRCQSTGTVYNPFKVEFKILLNWFLMTSILKKCFPLNRLMKRTREIVTWTLNVGAS